MLLLLRRKGENITAAAFDCKASSVVSLLQFECKHRHFSVEWEEGDRDSQWIRVDAGAGCKRKVSVCNDNDDDDDDDCGDGWDVDDGDDAGDCNDFDHDDDGDDDVDECDYVDDHDHDVDDVDERDVDDGDDDELWKAYYVSREILPARHMVDSAIITEHATKD